MKELAKLFSMHLKPCLSNRGIAFMGFENISYQIERITEHWAFSASGIYLTRWPGIEIEPPSRGIIFKKHFNVLNEVLLKNNLKGSSMSIFSYDNTDEVVKKRQEIAKVLVKDETTFLIWMEKFKEYWKQVVEPFFSKYSDIRALGERLTNPRYTNCESEFLEYHNNLKR